MYSRTSYPRTSAIFSSVVQPQLKFHARAIRTLACNFSSETTENSGNLTHVDSSGQIDMVDISHKERTSRRATARAFVFLGSDLISRINHLPKGDVVATAKLAGIMAAKQTSALIPLCHQIQLDSVNIDITFDENAGDAVIECQVKTKSTTGVEMEALTGAVIASLTLYDMCKAVNKSIVIRDVRLVSKTGGKHDFQLK